MGQGIYLHIHNRTHKEFKVDRDWTRGGSALQDDVNELRRLYIDKHSSARQYLEGHHSPFDKKSSGNSFSFGLSNTWVNDQDTWWGLFVGWAEDDVPFSWELHVGGSKTQRHKISVERGTASWRAIDDYENLAYYFELKVKDCGDQICIYLTITATKIDTEERDLRHLANKEFHIRNYWRYHENEYRCGMHMSFSGTDLRLYPKEDIGDIVPWLLVPVPNTKDQFYFRNRWGCARGEHRCDTHVSFTGTDVLLYPKDNVADLVPWKLIPVPNATNQYYIENRWGYDELDSRNGYHVSFSGLDVMLYPPESKGDLVPWEFTEV